MEHIAAKERKESRLNFTAIDHCHIQKGRIHFFKGETRLDNDGENEFLIASKSILQTPVKHQKRELYYNNSSSAKTQLKDESQKISKLLTISSKK